MKSNNNFGKFFVNGVGVHASIPGESFTNVVEAFHAYDRIKKSTGTGVIYMYVSQYETRVIAFTASSGNVSELIKKAEQGDADAQLEYARLLKTSGNGVEQDWKKAVEMIQLSAEKGNHDAEWELGALYEFANHMTQDSAKAIEWYRKSADAGSPIGLYMLAHCYQHGIAIEENHHISDSLYAKSVEELTKLASQEDMYVLNFLGSAYYWGDGVKEDRKKAFEYYLTSAKKGNPETQYKIGNCYETAQGTEKDMEKAKEWYRKSADQGYQDALDALERLWNK